MLISSSFIRQVNKRNYFSFCSVTNEIPNMEARLLILCDRVNFNFVCQTFVGETYIEGELITTEFISHIHQTILSERSGAQSQVNRKGRKIMNN